MQYIDMKGAKVPALGFGTWQLTGEACTESVLAAIKIGYRHIDTAQIYENEAEVGQAISQSGLARRDLFVTTKLWTTNFKAADVKASTKISLEKLRTDYVDLLLIHWPSEEVPLAETLSAMKELQGAGKVKAIGVSNFTVPLMRKAVEELGCPIACNQVEYHIMLSQKPVLDYAKTHGIAVTAYSPLARGQLNDHPVLQTIAKKHGKSVGQIALRWLIEQPGVIAIPKAASPDHIRDNFAIFDFTLDAEDRKAIAPLTGTTRLVNPPWAPAWDQAA